MIIITLPEIRHCTHPSPSLDVSGNSGWVNQSFHCREGSSWKPPYVSIQNLKECYLIYCTVFVFHVKHMFHVLKKTSFKPIFSYVPPEKQQLTVIRKTHVVCWIRGRSDFQLDRSKSRRRITIKPSWMWEKKWLPDLAPVSVWNCKIPQVLLIVSNIMCIYIYMHLSFINVCIHLF